MSLTRSCAFILALFLLIDSRDWSAASPPADDSPSLASTWIMSNGLVRDTNGDGIADSVAARISLPSAPTALEAQAAANLSARLGFETSALTLPIVVGSSEMGATSTVPIILGRENAAATRLAKEAGVDVKTLKPGQGVIAAVPNNGTSFALVVSGADDEGTLAAANVLAARLPRVWNMTGVTLRGVETQLAAYLQQQGIVAGAPIANAVVVDSDRRGIAAVHLRVPAEAAQASRGAKALETLDLAHRQGLEPTTLNFAEVATVTVQFGTGATAVRTSVRRAGLNARTLTPPIGPDELAPTSPGDRGAANDAPTAGAGKTFDLSTAYSNQGWFGDSYADLIPDRTETTLVLGGADDAVGAAHIAARLGLESTGVTLPIAKLDREVRDASREPSPILVGRGNSLLADLVKIGRARVDDLKPGEGVVQVVPRAFGNVTATVVAGADASGTEAAALYLARRIPYVWNNTRGALSYSDVREDLARVLNGKSAAGQAGQALHELDDVLDEVRDKTIESFDVKLFTETAVPAFDTYLAGRIRERVKNVQPTVASQAITDPVPVIDETFDVPWEVDDLREQIRRDVLPAVKAGAQVRLEARLSESPQVRERLAQEIRGELVKAGAAAPAVSVLSAYKQGFMWMTEQVIPSLKGRPVHSITVKIAEHKPDFSKKYKFYQVPSRWLHELYPVDEIAAKQLGVPKERFRMELVDSPADIYTVDALDAAGGLIERATFSPKFAEREYLDKFPGWSRVEVTTGWLRADVAGKTVVDTRIKTDPERFWDHYQSKVLPRIYDHVMKVTDNKPLPEKQPFHRDLDIEVWMSEPDFRIGVDEELVSSLESLHEDLYFVTLDFFDALGRTTTRNRLAGPGKIFPIIHPEQAGQPGKVRIRYSGNASTKPKMDIVYREKGSTSPTRISRDLGRIETTAPVILRAVVRADNVSELELQVEVKADREAARASEALDGIARLQAAGLFRDTLSYEHVGQVAVTVALQDARARRVLKNTGVWAPSNVRAPGPKPKLPLVTWDHVISPEESEMLVGRLAAFPEVKAYKAGHSYRGREISVMEITLPTASEQVSIAKLTALKPTIFVTGRQHANEVSSTSHILRLAEALATDPSYRDILKRVNVILHPVENPDGAAMAYELQKLTPTHMLHAGRYSALGMDVASQVGVADPLLPEALVRGRVWGEWLPDIYLNPHGYPSHEWVQQFAGYVPPGFRTYWSTRGWYTSVNGLRDPRYPAHVDAVDAVREAIVREINSNPDVREMNLRHQERYRKWAYGYAPYVYGQEIYKDTAIYFSDQETGEPRGSRRAGAGRGGGGARAAMSAWPQVTFVSGGTEAPDETAQGNWLDLVTKPGLSYVLAHVRYLRDGTYTVDCIEEEGQRETTTRTWLRVRPVMPAKTAAASSAGSKK